MTRRFDPSRPVWGWLLASVVGALVIVGLWAGYRALSPAAGPYRYLRLESDRIFDRVQAEVATGATLTDAVEEFARDPDPTSAFVVRVVTTGDSEEDSSVLWVKRPGVGGGYFSTEPDVSVCLGFSLVERGDGVRLRMEQVSCPARDESGEPVPTDVYDDPRVRSRTVDLPDT